MYRSLQREEESEEHIEGRGRLTLGAWGVTMLQSIYADRLSDEVLAVSASPDVRTEDRRKAGISRSLSLRS